MNSSFCSFLWYNALNSKGKKIFSSDLKYMSLLNLHIKDLLPQSILTFMCLVSSIISIDEFIFFIASFICIMINCNAKIKLIISTYLPPKLAKLLLQLNFVLFLLYIFQFYNFDQAFSQKNIIVRK